MPNTGCAVCLIHWNSMPDWKQNICLWKQFGDEGDFSCCIQGWGLLLCPVKWHPYQLHCLCRQNWYLTLSSFFWEYWKSFPLDLPLLILQNSEPQERLCRCHPALLCTRQSGCHSANSKTSPCWGAARWHEADLILDITSVLIWSQSFGPILKKKLFDSKSCWGFF